MKNFFANLAIVLGVGIAFLGVTGLPIFQDLLPVELMLPLNDKTDHQYWRLIPTESPSSDYLPYLLVLAGIAVFVVGIAFRRRLRGTTA